MGGREDLSAILADCRRAAHGALSVGQPFQEELARALRGFLETLEAVGIPDAAASGGLAEAVEAFGAEVERLKKAAGKAAAEDLKAVLDRYRKLKKAADHVTVVLFGRTKAGKSTTMEALTEGDGASIGEGRQHTTRKVSSYYWPPGQSCLRIIDTPGIEGFKGDDLATMALDFVDQADHILFLLSDDKASSGELDHLGRIRTLGKAVTVLLNVKKKDLDLLIEAPDLVFDAKALKEHSERIAAYLTQHYDIEDARVIPFHAGAAWASTQEEERERMAALRRASRIEDVEARLRGFAAKEARGARLRSPRDLLLSFIVNVKTELRPFAGVFRRWPAEFEGRFKSLDGPLKEIHARGVSRLKSIAAPTAEAASRVPALVDSLIAARKGGKRLASEWKGLLEETGVTTATTRFAEETRKDFEDELREQARVGRFDGALRPDEGADLGDVFSKVERMQEDENVNPASKSSATAAKSWCRASARAS